MYIRFNRSFRNFFGTEQFLKTNYHTPCTIYYAKQNNHSETYVWYVYFPDEWDDIPNAFSFQTKEFPLVTQGFQRVSVYFQGCKHNLHLKRQ